MLTLPSLPYDYDALAPAISGSTMRVHHRKHHAAYVEKTNALAEKTDLDGRCLRDIVIRAAARRAGGLYNKHRASLEP